MRKLMLLIPAILIGSYQTQDEKIEDYIPEDAAVVVRIGDLGKLYDGFSKTGLGKLFTDKEIGEFIKSIPAGKKFLDDVGQAIAEVEKKLGTKLDDLIRSVKDVWFASGPIKDFTPSALFAVRFKDKNFAQEAEKFLRSVDAKGKYESRGSVFFMAEPTSQILQKKADKNLTSNQLYKSALSTLKPQENGIFCFVNIESILKNQTLGETEKNLGVECFKYAAATIQPEGELVCWKIHAPIDSSVKGLIPELAKSISGKASLKDIPASSVYCFASGLNLASGLKTLEEFFGKHDKNTLDGIKQTSQNLKNSIGVDLYELVSLFNDMKFYVTSKEGFALADIVIGLKVSNAETLGRLVKYCEKNGILSKKDGDIYRLLIPNSPIPFDGVMVRGDTVYIAGSTEALKDHVNKKRACPKNRKGET